MKPSDILHDMYYGTKGGIPKGKTPDQEIEDRAMIVLMADERLRTLGRVVPEHNIKKVNAEENYIASDEAEDDIEDIPSSINTVRYDYISNSKLMISYEGNINSKKYEKWINILSAKKNLTIKFILISHTEEHTHILVIWNSRFQSRNKKIMDYKGIHPIIRYISEPNDLKRIKKYMEMTNIDN
jgi:hypothetical protein